jgi:alkylation response protein AidB-like acyl-CoA dehydrogenase
MISFTLSDEQKALREAVRSFARTHLASASSLYNSSATSSIQTPQGRFRSTRPIFEAAVKAGILKSQVPVPLGGTGGSVIDAALAVEELYAVESSISLTILANGLGLSPIVLGGSVEQKERWLKPFITGEGVPLASLVFSEPGGSANYLEPGSSGLRTTARLEGDEWVIDGEKVS